MAFRKSTLITIDGKSRWQNGAANLLRFKNTEFSDKIEIKICVFDNSGGGRGGHDGLWKITKKEKRNHLQLIEAWRECDAVGSASKNEQKILKNFNN
jgi:hypothetical protein